MIGDIGLSEEDIPVLQQEIGFVVDNCAVEALALCTVTGFQILYAALPTYQVDSDALAGISGALTMTGRTAMMAVFQENLSEIIVRAEDGFCVTTGAGRFVLVGAGRNIPELMNTVKTFRIAAARIRKTFPEEH
jgi:hypothetical protein